MKKAIICLAALLCFLLCGCEGERQDGISVVAVNFSAYDFARAAAGERAEVKMLLPAGTDTHNYEPSPADITAIENCDVFVYTGGESDSWVDKILGNIDTADKKIVKMIDCSRLLCEGEEHGGEEHGHSHETDEHVWLAPDNAQSITNEIAKALADTDPSNAEYYLENSEDYCKKILTVARETAEMVDGALVKKIVVADRFPLKYLCDYYSLEYTAAFDACDVFADADAATVIGLIDSVRESGIEYVYYIENGSGYVADTVAEATGADTLMINSMHTVSRDDFLSGTTYIDIMEYNKKVLERGLYSVADMY